MTSWAIDAYLTLLARTLTRYEMDQRLVPISPRRMSFAQQMLARRGVTLARMVEPDLAARETGHDWPPEAETMVGLRRLENLRHCLESVIHESVAGDFLEAGVWRGGASIYAAAVVKAHDATERGVWVADSFEGLPPPDVTRYGKDEADLSPFAELAVSMDQVRANFERYGLLGDNVHFLKGWFEDTLARAPIERISVLRLDGDLYSSTMDILLALYDRVSAGGFIIVDDYGAMHECERAVTDFRSDRGIDDEIVRIDWTGAYWRKS